MRYRGAIQRVVAFHGRLFSLQSYLLTRSDLGRKNESRSFNWDLLVVPLGPPRFVPVFQPYQPHWATAYEIRKVSKSFSIEISYWHQPPSKPITSLTRCLLTRKALLIKFLLSFLCYFEFLINLLRRNIYYLLIGESLKNNNEKLINFYDGWYLSTFVES